MREDNTLSGFLLGIWVYYLIVKVSVISGRFNVENFNSIDNLDIALTLCMIIGFILTRK